MKKKLHPKSGATSRTEQALNGIKNHPIFILLSALVALIAVVASVKTNISTIISPIETTLHISQPTATSTLATPTSSKNICKGVVGNSYSTYVPIGYTFCIYRGHKGPVNTVAWSPDGQRIVSGGMDGTIQTWNAFTGDNVVTYGKRRGSVTSVAWSPNQQRIASGAQDGTIQIWIADTGNLAYTYNVGDRSSVNSLAWSPDGQFILCGHKDGVTDLFYADSGTKIDSSSSIDNPPVTIVAWSSDSKHYAYASDDGTIQVWSNDPVNLNKHILTYKNPGSLVTALTWTPNGNSISYALTDKEVPKYGSLVILDASKGNKIPPILDTATLSVSLSPTIWKVGSLAWACNGKYLAIGEVIAQVEILNVAAKKEFYIYDGHADAINSLAWSPDGMQIASASDDGTVRVWQAAEKKECSS